MYIYDLTGNVERLTGHEATLERSDEVNGDRSIKFSVTRTPENAHAFDMLENEAVLELPINNQQYRVKTMDRSQQGQRINKSITAQHVFFDIIDSKTTREQKKTGSFAIDPLLSFVLAAAGWRFVIESGVYVSETFENFGGDNCLKSFNELVDRYHFEYIPDSVSKIVYIYGAMGSTTDAQIRYNHNLKTLKEKVDSNSLSTIGTAYGKVTNDAEGKFISQVTATYRHPNADIFGERWAEDWEDERHLTAAQVEKEIKLRLGDAAPELSIEAEYIELKQNGVNVHPFSLGDDLFLLHEKWGLDILARVMKITDFPYNRTKQPKITISNLRRNVKDKLASTTRRSIEAQKNALAAANKATLAEIKANSAGDNAEAQKARLDAILDENGNMTTASRLLYINSYVYADHRGLWAVDPQDTSRYAFFGSGGADFHKGMIRIVRPDGYEVMNNGMSVYDVAIQGASPAFKSDGVDILGWWFVTDSINTQSCDFFTYRHTSRYLKMMLGVCADEGGRCTISIERGSVGQGNLEILATYSTTSADRLNETTLTVDLGVPTGERRDFYLRIKTNDVNYRAQVRIRGQWLEK